MTTDLIGYAAATCTTISFLPQVVKVVREHDTHSLSLGMYVIFTVGVLLWGVYGYVKDDNVIIVANSVTAIFCVTILVVKLRNDGFGRKDTRTLIEQGIGASER